MFDKFKNTNELKLVSPQINLTLSKSILLFYDKSMMTDYAVVLMSLSKDQCDMVNIKTDTDLPVMICFNSAINSKDNWMLQDAGGEIKSVYNTVTDSVKIQDVMYPHTSGDKAPYEELPNLYFKLEHDQLKFDSGDLLLQFLASLMWWGWAYAIDNTDFYEIADVGEEYSEQLEEITKWVLSVLPKRWGELELDREFYAGRNSTVAPYNFCIEPKVEQRKQKVAWPYPSEESDLSALTLALSNHPLAGKLGVQQLDQDESNALKDLLEF